MSGRGFPVFQNDPFFNSHRDVFQNMTNYDPFHLSQNLPAIGGPAAANNQVAIRNDPLAYMNRMMQEMNRGFAGGRMMPDLNQMQACGEPVYMESYTGVRNYDNTRGGQPKIFEATSAYRQGPGGVKETQKTLKDSETGVNKMAIGHHINERGHVIERTMNNRTNERDQRQYFQGGLHQSQAEAFDQEWTQAAHKYLNARDVQTAPAIRNNTPYYTPPISNPYYTPPAIDYSPRTGRTM